MKLHPSQPHDLPPTRPAALTSGLRARPARRALPLARGPLGALVLGVLLASLPAAADEGARDGRAIHRVELRAELGFLGVLAHELQEGRSGSELDYRDEAAQDVLFPFSRYSLSLLLAERHRFQLVYQPLDLTTRETFDRPVTIEGTTYDAGTDMRFRYSFPFYRAGYAYVFGGGDTRLSAGAAIQIRNATLEFSRADGSQLVSLRDVGPVPLLHLGLRQELGAAAWLELEADGVYAPIRYLNGSDNGVEGALLDASARFGVEVDDRFDVFLNARYFGGGAEGEDESGPESYTSNWIHLLIFSAGVALH